MPRKIKKAVKITYRPLTIGKRTYKTSSAAVRFYLKVSNFTQVQIAQRCNVSAACVSQLAAELR